MPKSSNAKKALAKELLQKAIPYVEIQSILKEHYGSGMSNSTLQSLTQDNHRIRELEHQNEQLTMELKMYKRMYYELLDVVKEKIKE